MVHLFQIAAAVAIALESVAPAAQLLGVVMTALVLEAVASQPAPPPELVAAVRLQSPACRAAA